MPRIYRGLLIRERALAAKPTIDFPTRHFPFPVNKTFLFGFSLFPPTCVSPTMYQQLFIPPFMLDRKSKTTITWYSASWCAKAQPVTQLSDPRPVTARQVSICFLFFFSIFSHVFRNGSSYYSIFLGNNFYSLLCISLEKFS